ncbi:helix-turn-helix transcriptional regulator [Ruania rhizosphaerae]|uniref:helix-turn-helix transcriptional regulator n=1 Tax=Ruania rhizosphaerae TaxID=1840413 RepID=UPI0013592FAC|nr:LuxR C-terminal-related transcriptional regulator [Ruania rhizosphaerae]
MPSRHLPAPAAGTLPAPWPELRRPAIREPLRSTLAEGTSVMLIGDPGVGKTSLMANEITAAESRNTSGSRTEPAARTKTGDSTTIWLRTPAAMIATPWTVLEPLIGSSDVPGPDAIGRLVEACTDSLSQVEPVPTLVVDDVHLVDEATAVVLAELVHAGTAQLVSTCRRQPGPPAPLQSLLRRDRIERIDVSALDPAEVEELLTAALAGPVARQTSRDAWHLTGGNPLYLRELVRSLWEANVLVRVDGAWIWRDHSVVGDRLTDLIAAELTGLAEDERDLIDLLALAGPTAIHRLHGSVSDGTLQRSVQRGLVVTESHHHDGVPRARLAHPLHAEVSRATLLPGRRRELFHRLGARGTATRSERSHPAALFSMVDWALTCEVRPAAEDLVAAVHAAATVADLPLVRRLSDAALDLLEPADARAIDLLLVRAEAARFAGADASARADLDRVLPHLATSQHRLCWRYAQLRADLQQFSDDDADEALATVTATASGPLADSGLHEAQAADRMIRLAYAGRFAEGLPLLERFARDCADPELRLSVIGSLVLGLGQSGRGEEAIAIADGALSSWHEAVDWPWLLSEIVAARFMAAIWLGDPERATHPPHTEDRWARYDDAVTQLGSGRFHAARGEWSAAADHYRGALSGFALRDPTGFAGTAWAGLAYCLAALGDLDGAARARQSYDRIAPRGSRAVSSDNEVRVLAVAVALEEPDIDSRCAAVAEECAREELWLGVLLARHLGCVATARHRRPTAEQVDGVAQAAVRVDGLIPPELLAHTQALAAGDETLTARIAGRLIGRGVWVPAPLPTVTLTPRQQEIATLVRAGLSNREIAERLVVSLRTVDTHVGHIFTRLGVNSRADLATALARSARG